MPRKNASYTSRTRHGPHQESLSTGGSLTTECVDPWRCLENHHETLYWSSYLILTALLVITQFIALPVLLQMTLYTAPIIYIGSHLSLLQKEVCSVVWDTKMLA